MDLSGFFRALTDDEEAELRKKNGCGD